MDAAQRRSVLFKNAVRPPFGPMAMPARVTVAEAMVAGPWRPAPAQAGRDVPRAAARRPARPSDMLDAGRMLGGAFGHYLVWLGLASATRPSLHFLSREGAWLAGHYGRLRRRHPEGSRWARPVPLAVSRVSTFLPSLPGITQDALAPLVAQYPSATAANVLGSLGLAPSPEHLRHETAAALALPWSRPGVADRVLADPAVATRLAARHVAQRAALLRYLEQSGVAGQEPLLVADVGWHGSIQDNLARLLPQTPVAGFYLGLFPQPSAPPPNATKRGFVVQPADAARLRRRLRFVAPLEFAASDATPSTTGYEMQGARAAPVADPLLVVPAERPAFRAFQTAVAAGIDAAAGLRAPDPHVARRQVLHVLEAPPPALADLFFEAVRDDRYGAGTLRRGASRLAPGDVAAALASSARRRALGLRLAESGWPWALLARDLPRLAPLLRRLILAVDARL